MQNETPSTPPQDAQGLRVLIAGGGTGGHLFPGLALAEELTSRGAEEIRFCGTERGVEAREVPRAGYPLEILEVSGIKGRGIKGLFQGLSRLPRSYSQSKKILKSFSPHLVIGVGGYASGPMVLAAARSKIPTAIMEQNALPGFTNKVLGKVVDRVFIYLPEAGRFFSPKKTLRLGNPIRRAICEKLAAVETRPSGDGPLSILILGGSQGAKALNDLLPEALSLVERPLRITHQTGATDEARVKEAYAAKNLSAHVAAFFDDMATRYGEADLVICRAGATTIAELGVTGRPSILIPFPYAADNHQEVNARSLVDAGAALLFRQAEVTPEALAEAVRDLYDHPERRVAMSEAARSVGHPHAARDVVDACLELLREKGKITGEGQ